MRPCITVHHGQASIMYAILLHLQMYAETLYTEFNCFSRQLANTVLWHLHTILLLSNSMLVKDNQTLCRSS